MIIDSGAYRRQGISIIDGGDVSGGRIDNGACVSTGGGCIDNGACILTGGGCMGRWPNPTPPLTLLCVPNPA